MKILVLILTLITPFLVHATEQIADQLLYNGKRYDWNGYSPAFDTLKSFKVPDSAIVTTMNYSTYFVTYTIEHDSLFLTDVSILTNSKTGLNMKSVFKDFFPSKSKIPMNLYSRILLIPYGERVEVKKHNWTDRHFTNYLIFEFNAGNVEAAHDLSYANYNKLKKRLFKSFKRTPEYKQAIVTQSGDFEAFNSYRPKKYTINQYLEFIILRLVKTLRV